MIYKFIHAPFKSQNLKKCKNPSSTEGACVFSFFNYFKQFFQNIKMEIIWGESCIMNITKQVTKTSGVGTPQDLW